MFIAPSVIVDVPELGKYHILLSPEVRLEGKPAGPVLKVCPCDSTLSMIWQREELVMDRPYWTGVYVAVTDAGLRVVMTAIKAGNKEAQGLFDIEADWVRHVLTFRAKQAASQAVADNVLPQFESLFHPLKEGLNAPV